MNKSETIINLCKSLVEFQGEISNPKNTADNPFYKSKYAPLNEIINEVKPILKKHGLAVIQAPSGDGSNIIVTTMLLHESGEWIETEPLILKADKITAQGAGSAITYGRRYSLSAVLGISSEDDDDGNAVEPVKKPEYKKDMPVNQAATNPVVNPDCISEPQAKRLFAMAKGDADTIKKIIGIHGYVSTKDIKKADYQIICTEIETYFKSDADDSELPF